MAEGKSKLKENPTGAQASEPEKQKPLPVEAPPREVEVAGGKKEVKQETAKGTSEIKREIFRQEVVPDKDTTDKIGKLDINRDLESKEQREGFEALQFVTSTTLLGVLMEAGRQLDFLKKFENITALTAPPKPVPMIAEIEARFGASTPNSW